MREPTRKLWSPFVLLMAVALPSLGAIGCDAVIEEGTDCWQTEAGTFQRLPTLPANFFGEGSDAIPTAHAVIELEGVPLDPAFVAAPYPEGCGCPEDVEVELVWVDRHGSPVAGDSAHRVRQVPNLETEVDTCIRRGQNARFRNQGDAVKVDVELVALSLKSVEPLEVTYKAKGPEEGPTKLFDVFVTQGASQKKGSMTLTAGSVQARKAKGDILLENLPITYDVEFREHGGTATFSKTDLTTKLRSGTGGGTFNQTRP